MPKQSKPRQTRPKKDLNIPKTDKNELKQPKTS